MNLIAMTLFVTSNNRIKLPYQANPGAPYHFFCESECQRSDEQLEKRQIVIDILILDPLLLHTFHQ